MARLRCMLAILLALSGAPAAASGKEAPLKLRSSAFETGAEIPARHTCDGADVSPPLAWSDPPRATKSFALVVDDPDAPDPAAPRMRWVHWVVYDLPAEVRELSEGMKGFTPLPHGARRGRNDWGKAAWGGPCPPIGRHRYFFTLYALDVVLGERGAVTKAELEAAIAGHVLGKAELVGTYQRAR